MRFCVRKSLVALWAVLPTAISFEFVNPSSHGSQSSFSQGSAYPEHSVLQVNTSSTLASSKSPVTIGDLEYIAEGQAFDRTSRQWIVVTNKDLSVSNVFVMMLFFTGATTASDMTVYFNITAASSDTVPTSTSDASTSAPSASSSAATKAQLSPTTTVSDPPAGVTASNSNSATPSSSDLNASAKIGLGVGIPAAAVVGVLATWLILRRKRAPAAQGHKGQHQQDTVMPMGTHGLTGPTSRPVSKATTYGPASITNGSVRRPNTATGTMVYEASNEPANVSELYAPTYRGY
ncbi:hypothetical protein KVR01_013708 [Diaporthe batatas]|uniref:uncharacterized protein n=1 Tax=Diaporthe batatas TaxID=748121 RepID=UPI001D04B5A2|nr:uncharacterized protein KVR01_013708 [Diaporthe batatas]KAG8156474.1 hypothetical protein KVR01_013708 [Diaporthe batatas]